MISSIISWFVHTSFAQTSPSLGGLPNPISGGCNDLNCALQKVIGYLQLIAYPLLVIMVLWGGIVLMTAGGDEKRITQGKHTLMWAVIGFVFVLIATGVAAIVQSLF